MGILSFGHWMVVLLAGFLLFGPRRIADIIGDPGLGIRSLRDGLTGAGEAEEPEAGGALADAAGPERGASPAEPE